MRRSGERVSAPPDQERSLIHLALRLGAAGVPGWSAREKVLSNQAHRADGLLLPLLGASGNSTGATLLRELRERIRAGDDPLGCALINLREPAVRRASGVTYTPDRLVSAMASWAREQPTPQRIVDPGAGSGRFLLRTAALFPAARLIGVEIDPLAALIARANLVAAGLGRRARIEVADYRRIDLRSAERTLYIGNPPYVRHHLIARRWKDWFVARWRALGVAASRLAGLHVHFFLATLLNANRGDVGAFVTAAEWLDVNYGGALRQALRTHLGLRGLVIVDPAARPFPDATTTAAITLFRIGNNAAEVRVRRVEKLSRMGQLTGGNRVSRKRLQLESRWSRLAAVPPRRPHGLIELGEICRVHRGQATGANDVWIAGAAAAGLPDTLLVPTVTRARELILAGRLLRTGTPLRNVVDLPEHLEALNAETRCAVEAFLQDARLQGAHTSYLARHRRAWWAVGLRTAAPILATYMARRPPVFTRNEAGARHLNIAHGLYPRAALTEEQLLGLVDYLSANVSTADGRTYAGGLTKFEPREMERLLVPRPELLLSRGGSPQATFSQ